MSSVEDILSSDLFKGFLKSAVQDLKDSNIVNPTRKKKQHRKTFLGRVKPEDALMAEVKYGLLVSCITHCQLVGC